MSKSYRKININGEMWRWKVGHSHISIRGPNRESFSPWIDELTEIEDTERAAWKGYLQITPRVIRAYIFKATGMVDLVPTLKNVFYEKEAAAYAGGTLCIDIDGQTQMINLSDGWDEETKCWIALCYLRYKTPSHCFYNVALETVGSVTKYKKELTLALLKASSV